MRIESIREDTKQCVSSEEGSVIWLDGNKLNTEYRFPAVPVRDYGLRRSSIEGVHANNILENTVCFYHVFQNTYMGNLKYLFAQVSSSARSQFEIKPSQGFRHLPSPIQRTIAGII